MLHFFIEIKSKIDSRKLYALIGRDGINVTDLGDIVLVYGEANIEHLTSVLYYCASFGDIKATINH